MVLRICMYTCILLRAIQIDVQYVEKDVQSMTEALYTINGEVWMDLGGIIVELYSHTQRICCKEHGIKTAPSTGSSGSRFETSGLQNNKEFCFQDRSQPIPDTL